VIGERPKTADGKGAGLRRPGYTHRERPFRRDAMKRGKNPPGRLFTTTGSATSASTAPARSGPGLRPGGRGCAILNNLASKLWVNGELMQDSHTSRLIFRYRRTIAMLLRA